VNGNTVLEITKVANCTFYFIKYEILNEHQNGGEEQIIIPFLSAVLEISTQMVVCCSGP